MTIIDAIADRVSRGEDLDIADARTLLDSYDLIAIGMMADEVRRRMHGRRTTFVRVFEVPVDAPQAALPPGVAAGEFRIVGRPATLDAALTAVRSARALAGTIPLTGFGLADLVALAPAAADRRHVFSRLTEAGLNAVAELAVDDPPGVVDAVPIAREAGLAVPRLIVRTLNAPADAAENQTTTEHQIRAIEYARALQTRVAGFRAFAPLPRTMPVGAPTTGYDDVKQIALARLVVTGIDSIQVDWARYGPKLAQVALTVGADDVDGVAAVDAGALGTRRSPLEEIRRNIRAAALEPVERDGLFRVT